jgi:SH3-like domain-containing protein
VNARGGPGDDYKLLWVYHARGLPLQVVAETYDWRRVCGPDGSLAWVHRRTVDARRTVMRTASQPLSLRRGPNPKSPIAAYLAPHALAGLETCKNGWCRVSADGVKGWAPETEVLGLSDTPQCRPPVPSKGR